MSGILGLFPRNGSSVDREALAGPFQALAHRGRFGSRLEVTESWALGHHAFETPVGRQPVPQPHRRGDALVALDGYVDNREELARELGSSPAAEDPELVLAAYERWGEGMFRRLVGSWALLLVDEGRRLALAARDPQGDRPLVYHSAPNRVLLASEEQALLRDPRVGEEPDETTLAHFFAVWPLPAGRTFFADLRAVPPGRYLRITGDGLETLCFWEPPQRDFGDRRPDREWLEEARAVFREAVRCRMRRPAATAVLMSGGLDSTAVTAEAAAFLEERSPGSRLHTISWIFEELPEADERTWMDPMVAAFRLRPTRIPADGLWPLRDPETWPVIPNLPAQTPNRRLLEKAYESAREAGTTCLLPGDDGDQLYVGSSAWLRELAREGRWLTALGRSLAEATVYRGRGVALRSAVKRCVKAPAWGYPAAPWLTDRARALLEPPEPLGGPRPEQLRALTYPWASCFETGEASRAGIEIRRPYRDLRLVELFLRMPAHLLYRPGWTKWVTRETMRGRLPEAVRTRTRRTTMLGLVQRGLLGEERHTVTRLLDTSDAAWRRYVDPEWLRERFPRDLAAGGHGAASLVPWHCLSLQYWVRSFGCFAEGSGLTAAASR